MGNRNGVFKFFLFLFLAVVILLQVLSMIQADRLFERVNRLEKTVQNSGSFSGFPMSGTNLPSRDANEGDWLVIGMSGEPRTLNPFTSTDSAASEILSGTMGNGLVFESLLQYDPEELKLKPLLAQSYEVSPDGLQITFTLKSDVHFSDGKPVTVEDVLFSYETIKNPGIDASHAANYFNNFVEGKILDEKTIRFTLREPYFKAIETIGNLSVIPRHVYAFKDPNEFNKIRSEPLGSGPYVFEKWDVGRQIVLRRNERYWGQRHPLHKIIYKFITNEIAALQALRSHEVDMLDASSEQFVNLSTDPKFTAEFDCLKNWNPRGTYSYIGWNNAREIFSDSRVRRAMTHMINRELIRIEIGKGLSQIVSGPFSPFGNQADPNIKPWPYDPKMAAKLLEEAGWIDRDGDGIRDKDGKPFKFRLMMPSGSPVGERIGKVIKDDAARVGVSLSIDPYEWSVMIERLRNHDFDATSGGWGGVIEEDPFQIWHSSQANARGSNYISFRNPEADKLIEQARKTINDNQRNKLYHQFHSLLHNEQPYTFMFTRPELRFVDKRFKNVKIHKLGIDEREWYVPKDQQRYK